MTHYLIIIENYNCMGMNKEALYKWAKMIKPKVELEECAPEGNGFYKCILIKESGSLGSSFSADTYNKLMEKVNEAILCNN